MTSDNLAPFFADAELSGETVRARRAAEDLFEETRHHVQTSIEGRLAAYRSVLDDLGELLRIPLDTSVLDLTADTRWTAVWQVSARTISMTYGLLAQIEAGLGEECFATARAIHEANLLIQVFVDPEETSLLRQWLRDVPPKPSTIRKAIERSDRRENARRQTAGEEGFDSRRELLEALYRGLSSSAHLQRSSTQRGVSVTRRTLVVGPDPDWGVRAYHTVWAGAVVWEVVNYVMLGQTVAGGSALMEPIADAFNARLEAADEEFPISEEHERWQAVEIGRVEGD
ncbi:MAG: hypothetical protein JSS99_11540 [Actinobacteria bacterium]|nr:hypothetical protein [Actinomycetota bacterium]